VKVDKENAGMTLHPINPLYKNTPARAGPITNISKSILNFRLELFSNTTNLGGYD
jgi:hypothetical protein